MYDTPSEPGTYPRAFFSKGDLPALRAKLEHPDCAATWHRLLHACEQMLMPQPDAVFKRHIRAEHMAFAWLMTGRDAFADKSRDMVHAIAARDVFDTPSPHGRAGLGTGGAMRQIALTYDWLYDYLSTDDRHTLREAARVKAFEPVLADEADGMPYTRWYTNNGINVLNAPVLIAAMLFEDDMDTRAIYDLTLKQLRSAVLAHCPDGGYPEGPGYWNYGIRYMVKAVVALRRLRGIDLFREPFLRNTGDYLLHFLHPGMLRSANPADALSYTKLWPAIAALAAAHREPKWQWVARRLLQHDWGLDGEGIEYSLMYLVYYDPDLPDAPPPASETTCLFSGLQNLSLRSDWTDDAVHVLWLNGPANCHHNHLHLNSFTVNAFGERLLIDMGKHDYANYSDYRRLTEGHNTLLADGESQLITTDDDIFCRRIRAGQWGTVYGEFQSLRDEAGATIATGHTVNAYAGRLRTFDRTLAFVDRQYLFLHDVVEREQASAIPLTWLFHTGGEATLEQVDDHTLHVTVTVGRAMLTMRFSADTAITGTIVHSYHELDNTDGPYASLRIDAVLSGDACQLFGLLTPSRMDAVPDTSLTIDGDVAHLPVDGSVRQYLATAKKLFEGDAQQPTAV